MYDLAVVGLGALGVHVAAEATRRGLKVVGFEARGGGHEHAATGGQTRIFRMVYTFGRDYVPALRRAKSAWDDLALEHPDIRASGGALLIGADSDAEILQALDAAEAGRLPHEVLDEDALRDRFPQHRLLPSDIALYDPAGALLFPQRVTAAVRAKAAAAGADLRYETPIDRIEKLGRGQQEVVTEKGERFGARAVVIAAGAWSGRFAPAFDDAVEFRRATLYWYATERPADFGPDKFPVGLRRSGDVRYSFFPQVDASGIKINFHAPKPVVPGPSDGEFALPSALGVWEAQLGQTISGLRPRSRSASYIESYTPDYRVLVDRLTGGDDTWLVAAGSGQAFKFAPVLAEHVVERVLGEQPSLSLQGVVRGMSEQPAAAVVGP